MKLKLKKDTIYWIGILIFAIFYETVKSRMSSPAFLFSAISYALCLNLLSHKIGIPLNRPETDEVESARQEQRFVLSILEFAGIHLLFILLVFSFLHLIFWDLDTLSNTPLDLESMLTVSNLNYYLKITLESSGVFAALILIGRYFKKDIPISYTEVFLIAIISVTIFAALHFFIKWPAVFSKLLIAQLFGWGLILLRSRIRKSNV